MDVDAILATQLVGSEASDKAEALLATRLSKSSDVIEQYATAHNLTSPQRLQLFSKSDLPEQRQYVLQHMHRLLDAPWSVVFAALQALLGLEPPDGSVSTAAGVSNQPVSQPASQPSVAASAPSNVSWADAFDVSCTHLRDFIRHMRTEDMPQALSITGAGYDMTAVPSSARTSSPSPRSTASNMSRAPSGLSIHTLRYQSGLLQSLQPLLAALLEKLAADALPDAGMPLLLALLPGAQPSTVQQLLMPTIAQLASSDAQVEHRRKAAALIGAAWCLPDAAVSSAATLHTALLPTMLVLSEDVEAVVRAETGVAIGLALARSGAGWQGAACAWRDMVLVQEGGMPASPPVLAAQLAGQLDAGHAKPEPALEQALLGLLSDEQSEVACATCEAALAGWQWWPRAVKGAACVPAVVGLVADATGFLSVLQMAGLSVLALPLPSILRQQQNSPGSDSPSPTCAGPQALAATAAASHSTPDAHATILHRTGSSVARTAVQRSELLDRLLPLVPKLLVQALLCGDLISSVRRARRPVPQPLDLAADPTLASAEQDSVTPDSPVLRKLSIPASPTSTRTRPSQRQSLSLLMSQLAPAGSERNIIQGSTAYASVTPMYGNLPSPTSMASVPDTSTAESTARPRSRHASRASLLSFIQPDSTEFAAPAAARIAKAQQEAAQGPLLPATMLLLRACCVQYSPTQRREQAARVLPGVILHCSLEQACAGPLGLYTGLLADAAGSVRAAAATSLAAIASFVGPATTAAWLLPHLIRLLNDTTPAVRGHAFAALPWLLLHGMAGLPARTDARRAMGLALISALTGPAHVAAAASARGSGPWRQSLAMLRAAQLLPHLHDGPECMDWAVSVLETCLSVTSTALTRTALMRSSTRDVSMRRLCIGPLPTTAPAASTAAHEWEASPLALLCARCSAASAGTGATSAVLAGGTSASSLGSSSSSLAASSFLPTCDTGGASQFGGSAPSLSVLSTPGTTCSRCGAVITPGGPDAGSRVGGASAAPSRQTSAANTTSERSSPALLLTPPMQLQRGAVAVLVWSARHAPRRHTRVGLVEFATTALPRALTVHVRRLYLHAFGAACWVFSARTICTVWIPPLLAMACHDPSDALRVAALQQLRRWVLWWMAPLAAVPTVSDIVSKLLPLARAKPGRGADAAAQLDGAAGTPLPSAAARGHSSAMSDHSCGSICSDDDEDDDEYSSAAPTGRSADGDDLASVPAAVQAAADSVLCLLLAVSSVCARIQHLIDKQDVPAAAGAFAEERERQAASRASRASSSRTSPRAGTKALPPRSANGTKLAPMGTLPARQQELQQQAEAQRSSQHSAASGSSAAVSTSSAVAQPDAADTLQAVEPVLPATRSAFSFQPGLVVSTRRTTLSRRAAIRSTGRDLPPLSTSAATTPTASATTPLGSAAAAGASTAPGFPSSPITPAPIATPNTGKLKSIVSFVASRLGGAGRTPSDPAADASKPAASGSSGGPEAQPLPSSTSHDDSAQRDAPLIWLLLGSRHEMKPVVWACVIAALRESLAAARQAGLDALLYHRHGADTADGERCCLAASTAVYNDVWAGPGCFLLVNPHAVFSRAGTVRFTAHAPQRKHTLDSGPAASTQPPEAMPTDATSDVASAIKARCLAGTHVLVSATSANQRALAGSPPGQTVADELGGLARVKAWASAAGARAISLAAAELATGGVERMQSLQELGTVRCASSCVLFSLSQATLSSAAVAALRAESVPREWVLPDDPGLSSAEPCSLLQAITALPRPDPPQATGMAYFRALDTRNEIAERAVAAGTTAEDDALRRVAMAKRKSDGPGKARRATAIGLPAVQHAGPLSGAGTAGRRHPLVPPLKMAAVRRLKAETQAQAARGAKSRSTASAALARLAQPSAVPEKQR